MINKLTYYLFLDDIREPDWITIYKTDPSYNKLQWVVVRNHNELVDYVTKNGMPELVSLDHDLADEHYQVTSVAIRNGFDISKDFTEKTGYDSLKWLCNYALDNHIKLPKMKFHTANYIGFKNMSTYYANFITHHPELK